MGIASYKCFNFILDYTFVTFIWNLFSLVEINVIIIYIGLLVAKLKSCIPRAWWLGRQ